MTSPPIFERSGRPEQAGHRLLVISYHFPPDPTIGARRWERLAPFVAERGWGLDVIACAPAAAADLRRLEMLPAGIRVFGVPVVTLAVEPLERRAWELYRALRRLVRRAAPGAPTRDRRPWPGAPTRPEWIDRTAIRWRLYSPRGLLRTYWTLVQHAKYGAWNDQAGAIAAAIVERGVHFAVVTSGPPHRTHDLGRAVSAHTGIPFVMDMRDPWSLSERLHESVASPLWFRLARRHEGRAVRAAALVVANTEAAREALVAAYPGAGSRVVTVMNGSDDDPLPLSTSGPRFTIAYAGTIYLEQHPRSLFRAAASVIGKLGLRPEDFGIDFIGGDDPGQEALKAMARDEGVEAFVTTAPARSHAEALEFLARGTMNVIFPGWDAVAIPAKIFECIRFDAWLLALADPGSATDRLLRGTGADVVPPGDPAAIASVILHRYEAHRRGVRPGRVVADDRFSRRAQARILLDAIARLGATTEN
jgi:hypothetical protein